MFHVDFPFKSSIYPWREAESSWGVPWRRLDVDALEWGRQQIPLERLQSQRRMAYPLVNVYILPWKIHPFWMGKSTISMVIIAIYSGFSH